jgi:hypothetical protein
MRNFREWCEMNIQTQTYYIINENLLLLKIECLKELKNKVV